MPNRLRLAVLASILSIPSLAAAQPKLEPGEWESKSTTTIAGLQSGPIERTMTSCYTSGDQKIFGDKDAWAADMTKATGDGCKSQDVKLEGTALSMTIVCPENRRVELRHDFRGTTGSMDTKSSDGNPNNTTTSHIEMRRIAEKCSEESIEQWKAWNPGKDFVP